MPKYFPYQVYGYYLYFTSKCIVEAFHVHASTKGLTAAGSAKFWVGADGTVKIQNKGRISNATLKRLAIYISDNYMVMYQEHWLPAGGKPEFYRNT